MSSQLKQQLDQHGVDWAQRDSHRRQIFFSSWFALNVPRHETWRWQRKLWVGVLSLLFWVGALEPMAIATPLMQPSVAPMAIAESAANLERGQQIFQRNCTACHVGGKNLIVPDKNLSLAALHRYGKDSVAAIVRQVTYGNGVMPPFGNSFSEEDIKHVASYVLNQARQGWNSSANLPLDAHSDSQSAPIPSPDQRGQQRQNRHHDQHHHERGHRMQHRCRTDCSDAAPD